MIEKIIAIVSGLTLAISLFSCIAVIIIYFSEKKRSEKN